MTATWLHSASAPLKRIAPSFVWKPVRSLVTALATPIRFSYTSGHFRSSLANRALDKSGNALPWYTYPAIEFLKRREYGSRSILEFGSGQSTLWWAERSRSVLAIEEDGQWASEVSAKVGTNAEVIHLPLSAGVASVAERIEGKVFDIIVIDGHDRAALVDLAFSCLRPSGAIIMDNSEGYGFDAAVRKHDCQRIDFHGHAPGVLLSHCTSIAFKGDCFLFSAEAPIR